MKKTKFIITVILISLMTTFVSCTKRAHGTKDDVFSVIEQQHYDMLQVIGEQEKLPRSTNDDGVLRLVDAKDWTSGFFPGNLWFQYEYSQDEKWRTLAEGQTDKIKSQQYNTTTHDLGFMLYCSFGNGYRLTKNEEYKEILIQSAKSLATRYSPIVKGICSWDHHKDEWAFPIIIDNMMNLELLFWATQVTGDSTFYNIAINHAKTTMKNHFRDDNSCYHVVGYNSNTGEVEKKTTHQGIADESAWARGQAWGIYGFTMTYRETNDNSFLEQAVRIADFVVNHKNTPEDGIVYWDYDDPKIPNAPRDASAAAVIASALYELTLYVSDEKKALYKSYADKVITSLSTAKYLAKAGSNNNFILKHSTGNYPKDDEIDQPLIYADYYFIEALLRKEKIAQKKNLL